MMMMRKNAKKSGPATDFESLSDAEKEGIYREIDSTSPRDLLARSRPLDAANRKRHQKFMNKGGRPKLGKDGVKVISLSVEKQLLKRADAYAKNHGLKRAEFFSDAIRGALAKAM